MIPEKEREQISSQILRVLDLGGMMAFEETKMFDGTIRLLRPVRQMKENQVHFYYNYFEDCCWESVAFNIEKAELWSVKVGSGEFADTMRAAYTLYELYLPEYEFALHDGEFIEASYTEGWLNHILKTDFALGKRANFWKCIEQRMCSGDEDRYDLERMMKLVPQDRMDAINGIEFLDLYIIDGGQKA